MDDRECDLIEYDDYWVIPLRGRSLSRVIVGYGLTLEFLDPEDQQITIMIAGEFRLESDGHDFILSHEHPTALGPALGLLGQTVESARAHKDGRLEIKYAAGSKLSVMAAPSYEAWTVTGMRWLRIICMPGGDLAVWKPEPASQN